MDEATRQAAPRGPYSGEGDSFMDTEDVPSVPVRASTPLREGPIERPVEAPSSDIRSIMHEMLGTFMQRMTGAQESFQDRIEEKVQALHPSPAPSTSREMPPPLPDSAKTNCWRSCLYMGLSEDGSKLITPAGNLEV